MRNTRRRPPAALVAAAAAGTLVTIVPLAAMVQRAPWSEVWEQLASERSRDALWLSLLTSSAATAIALVLGVPLAWVLAKVSFPGRALLRAMVILPMVLPPVAGGIALILAFGRRGLVGEWLDDTFGITIPFTRVGVVLAQTFVAMPFLVLAVEAGFRGLDPRLEDAASTLGARPLHVFRRVTLPLVAPAVGAGAALCWARALGEFGATITFNGSIQGRTETAPIAVFILLESGEREGAIALSLVLLAVSLTILVVLRGRLFASS
jgi:molybdate transport system permease protein